MGYSATVSSLVSSPALVCRTDLWVPASSPELAEERSHPPINHGFAGQRCVPVRARVTSQGPVTAPGVALAGLR